MRGHVPPHQGDGRIVPPPPPENPSASVTRPPLHVVVVRPDSAPRLVSRCLKCGGFSRPGYDGNSYGHLTPNGWCESPSEDGEWRPT